MVSSVLHILGAAPYDVDGVDLQLMCSQRNPVCSATRALTIPGMYPRTVNRMLIRTVAKICIQHCFPVSLSSTISLTVSTAATLQEDTKRWARQ